MKHLLIAPETCLGDRRHNEAIKKIMSAKGPYAFKVFKGLADIQASRLARENERCIKLGMVPREKIWCEIEKQEAQRIYAIANAKTKVTFVKRSESYARFLRDKEHYGALFNREYIDLFYDLSKAV